MCKAVIMKTDLSFVLLFVAASTIGLVTHVTLEVHDPAYLYGV